MSYEFDVFLSYRRLNQWPKFVEKTFLPMLDHWLTTELGEPARIFFDVKDVEVGHAWPQRLADGLSSSKLMVCLLSREYFSSKWCAEELGHMLARREATIKDGKPLPLIIAVVIHDGDTFPAEIADIQRYPIQDYANPWLRAGGRHSEKLSNEIKRLCESIRKACQVAPPHDPEWGKLATVKFIRLFTERSRQANLPSLGDFE
jgi:hypothetical protein